MHFLVVPSNKSQLNINATGVIVCKLGLRLLGGSSFAVVSAHKCAPVGVVSPSVEYDIAAND